MDPRLQIIRCVIALLASLALLWWEPMLAWVPVALFMPPLFEPDICSACSGSRPSFQLDLSGFTDGTCSTCDTAYNGSFTLAVSGACQWSYSIPSGFCTSGLTNFNLFTLELSGTDPYTITVRLRTTFGGGHILYIWEKTGVTPKPSCSGFSSYAVPYSAGWNQFGASDECNGDGSSAVLTSL
jgi:hypothetical protein